MKTYAVGSVTSFVVAGGFATLVGCAIVVVCLLNWANLLELNGTYGFDLSDLILLGFGVAFCRFGVLWLIQEPYEIRIRDDRSIVFRKIFGGTVVIPQQIQHIEKATRRFTVESIFVSEDRRRVLITHTGGKLSIPMFDQAHEFISTIVALNPIISVEGDW